MSFSQLVGVASIVNPELGARVFDLIREAYVREIVQEAGLHPIIADLVLEKLWQKEVMVKNKEVEVPIV